MQIQHLGRIFHYGLHFEMEDWYVEVSDNNDWEYEYNPEVDSMVPIKHNGIWLYVLYNGDIEIQAEDEWEFFPANFDFSFFTFGFLPPIF